MVVSVAASQDLVDALAIAVDSRFEIAHEADLTLLSDRYRSRRVFALILDFRGIRNPHPRMIDESLRGRVFGAVIAVVDRSQFRLAIEAVQHGASDCLSAPVSAIRLRESLRKVLIRWISEENEDSVYKRAPVGMEGARRALRPIAGSSCAVQRLRSACIRASCSHAPLLIGGETGAGKENVARAIHDLTHGPDRPYVATNICALPEPLFEGHLFGVRGGAYTGALQSEGLFKRAHGGTLFLDEIGDLAYPLQSKLLRAVEYGRFLPLGANAEETVATRLVSSTNRDLDVAIQDGAFRADLFYRLSILAIRVPSLRERVEDIPELLGAITREIGRPEIRFGSDAIALLQDQRWPGNLRELKAVVERSIAATDRTLLRSRDIRFDRFL